MKGKINKWYVIIFCFLFFTVCTLNILTPQKEFSENENRYLAKFPDLSIKRILDGKFMEQFESYATDQFICRDFFVAFKAETEKKIGKSENNGVYFAKDNFLIEKPGKVNEKTLNNNINSISSFGNTGKYDVTFLLAPTAYESLPKLLPKFAYSKSNQRDIMERVENGVSEKGVLFVNPIDELRGNSNMYYQTDHHWTTEGAFEAYKVLMDVWGIEPYNDDSFDKTIVTGEFYGTTWSKAALWNIPPDEITLFKPKFPVSYNVMYENGEKTDDKLYAREWLSKKDKYNIFLDGNHSITVINTGLKEKEEIAIFKDSYSHCLIPFLANHFSKIHVIDLRYYNYNPIEYLENHQINRVLFIYNSNNFISDTNISKIGAFLK